MCVVRCVLFVGWCMLLDVCDVLFAVCVLCVVFGDCCVLCVVLVLFVVSCCVSCVVVCCSLFVGVRC